MKQRREALRLSSALALRDTKRCIIGYSVATQAPAATPSRRQAVSPAAAVLTKTWSAENGDSLDQCARMKTHFSLVNAAAL